METQTITVNLSLVPWKVDLLNSLEVNSKVPKETFVNDLLNSKTTWEDLEDINDVLLAEQDPNTKFLSDEEASQYLKHLYHPDKHQFVPQT